MLPAWRDRKVVDITFGDVDALHRKISKQGIRGRPAPYRANRTVAALSKMFSLSVRWKWRPDNPAIGIERNQEHKRRRYLKPDELNALLATLSERDAAAGRGRGGRRDQPADIVRLSYC